MPSPTSPSTETLNTLALLFYDYFLTLGWESSRYWGAKASWPTVLFFLNRYGTLLGNVPVVIQAFWTAPVSTNKISMYTAFSNGLYFDPHPYFIIIIQIIVGVMLILRTYALYQRSKRVLSLLVVFSAGVIGVGVWSTVFSGTAGNPGADLPLYIGCTYEITKPQSVGLVIAWAAMGVFDCLIFFLTLYRALSQRHRTRLPLLTVLLRDGSVYFGVMVISNLSNILTFLFGGPYTRGVATTFTNIISSLMISRLMLNLRDPSLSTISNRSGCDPTSRDTMFSTYLTPSTAGHDHGGLPTILHRHGNGLSPSSNGPPSSA
ncbi:hypothetical protein C8R43DRAFT_1133724 [Mycena crocata]|nr:hypothetical protein C8R43DRAFT_1133724 [Mycena crocata]